MLDVRRLRLLRELARRGTIAAVAEALSFTSSAVSQQLSVLEREAGSALLERSGRRVVLTPAGMDLVAHTEVILERLERAAADLDAARQGLAGVVRIGTFPTATRTVVLAALRALAEAHPRLETRVSERDPAGVAHALRSGDLDVALVHDYDFVPAPVEPGVATTGPLFTECMYLASTNPGATGVESCAAAPWITATTGSLCHTMAVRACQAAGFEPRIRHRVDEFATVLALVADGHGVALVPELAAADPPPGVVLTELSLRRRSAVAFRDGAAGHPAVAAVVAALRDAVPAGLLSRAPRAPSTAAR